MSGERPDLSEFRALNAEKPAWDERVKVIEDRFPTTVELDWKHAFKKDPDLFAWILRDILKVDQAVPGKPGPRPGLRVHDATRRVYQWMGQDYTTMAFPQALDLLARGKSHRSLARKVGLDRNVVQRLLWGRLRPDLFVLTTIAEAFDKHPSYFLEYRTAYIANALLVRLEGMPDATVDLYRRLALELAKDEADS